MVNRVIRDDPSKGTMHNREPITPKLLWKSLNDYDLWPIYIIGVTFQTPMSTPKQYLTLTLKGLGFNTFVTNLLVIPSEVLSIFFILTITYISEITGELTLTAMVGQIWALPFLLYIYIVDINAVNKWGVWVVMTLLLAFPNGKPSPSRLQTRIPEVIAHKITAHAIQVAWNSRNSNTVRSRTVSAAMYNMCVQSSGIIASNIYRAG
jgi:hypothetical protein